MAEEKKKILIVDDEEDIRGLLGQLLAQDGYVCYLAADGEEALEQLQKRDVDAVITDIKMPGIDGIALTKKVVDQYKIPVIVMTGFASDFSTTDAEEAGAADFIIKPFSVAEVSARFKKILQKK